MSSAPASSTASVAALIPALDAAATVGAVVRATKEQLAHVLVVDDGSRDGTAEAAAEAGAELVRHVHNRGKGAALQTGMEHLLAAGYDAVVTLDADGQHRPDQIPALLAAAAGATRDEALALDSVDLVLGARDHLFAGMSRLRRVSNRLSSGAISFAAGQSLPDCQTGFRLYARRLIEAFAMPGSGFEAESAIIVLACRQGFRVATAPVEMGRVDGRVGSHYRPLRDSLRIAAAVTRARLRPHSLARAGR